MSEQTKQTNKQQPTRTIWNTDSRNRPINATRILDICELWEKRQDIEFQHLFRINIRKQLLMLRSQIVDLTVDWM